jgi:hypothetical protein
VPIVVKSRKKMGRPRKPLVLSEEDRALFASCGIDEAIVKQRYLVLREELGVRKLAEDQTLSEFRIQARARLAIRGEPGPELPVVAFGSEPEPKPEPEPEPEPEPPVQESDSKPAVRPLFRSRNRKNGVVFDPDRAPDKRECAAKLRATTLDDIRWVASVLPIKGVTIDDAPSTSAYGLLLWARASAQNEGEFYKTVLLKTVPTRSQLDRMEQYQDDGRDLESKLLRFRSELIGSKGGGSAAASG